MIKGYEFDQLSTKVCRIKHCLKHLKQRLVDTKLPHNITLCYGHSIKQKRNDQIEKNQSARV